MIIGNNGFGNNNRFITPGNNIYGKDSENNKNNNNQMENNDIFNEKNKVNAFVDPSSRDDMSDKSLAMLHDRYKNGLITLEEFNKKCTQLGKKRIK